MGMFRSMMPIVSICSTSISLFEKAATITINKMMML
jgi:hypothetical protein